MTDPATQPEAPVEPQQPATAPHSDAHGQREQLRRRLTRALHDADCSHRTCSCVMGHYAKLADAVLPILDEELVRATYERDLYRDRLQLAINEKESLWRERDALRQRAETAEAGLVESSWPDGGPDDDPPEVKLAGLRERAEQAEISVMELSGKLHDAEQERNALREHVDADHQVLQEVRHHADRLREWCRDEHASATIAGSIIADLQKTLNGDVDA